MKTMLGHTGSRWWLGILLFTAAGCTTPTAPPPAPGGGQEFVLSYETFQESVAPVLVEYGCHAVECHGGGIRDEPPPRSVVAVDWLDGHGHLRVDFGKRFLLI